ncbi:response regulator [Sphingomonas sp. NBWT7]|uniref:response regulator n=1 Tax=Sphingomonas sp. NBWT7 TaxID=2596913 RepID=UPI0016273E98|nr:response regulator [Sphingomonas sp. NBWT7]QNE32502.1 response regulator [Sphingomonas sp. NBWT7]
MDDGAGQRGLSESGRILIVEDDYFIAHDLANGFEKAGIRIIGPVPSLSQALAILEQHRIDGAVLDINLDGEKVYEVADALMARGVPVVFVTGYERPSIPSRYDGVPLCLKPIEVSRVIEALGRPE